MTALDIKKAQQTTERVKRTVAANQATIADVRKREAHLDQVLATSQIRADRYRDVLRRAGLLKS
jgi:predicted  nucleic acid-binding Zn-ribbon protein